MFVWTDFIFFVILFKHFKWTTRKKIHKLMLCYFNSFIVSRVEDSCFWYVMEKKTYEQKTRYIKLKEISCSYCHLYIEHPMHYTQMFMVWIKSSLTLIWYGHLYVIVVWRRYTNTHLACVNEHRFLYIFVFVVSASFIEMFHHVTMNMSIFC